MCGIMKAIIFDAFGTLFKVATGGSAQIIMKNITDDILGPKALGIKTVWMDRTVWAVTSDKTILLTI